jgi:hypothetical protein
MPSNNVPQKQDRFVLQFLEMFLVIYCSAGARIGPPPQRSAKLDDG